MKSYCNQCKAPRKPGYCAGTKDAPHPPEPCPPCSGCSRKVCDWTHERGCSRFTLNAAASEYARKKVEA